MCRVFSDRSLGTASITDAGGVADIRSPRRLQTTGSDPEMRRAPAGATEWRRAISAAPAGDRIQCSRRTGDLHHRLISNVPSGQLAAPWIRSDASEESLPQR